MNKDYYTEDAINLNRPEGLCAYAVLSSSAKGRKIFLTPIWIMATIGALIGINLQLWPLALYSIMAAFGVTFAFHNASTWQNRKEILRFSQNHFEITRHHQNLKKPPEILHLQAFGLGFSLSDDDSKTIYATSRGQNVEIAPFMAPEKRKEFIKVLRNGHEFWSLPNHIKDEIRQYNRGKTPHDARDKLSGQNADVVS